MIFNIVDSKSKLTMESLEKAERIIGIRLPDDYRAFLLAHNGGRPEPDVEFYFKYPVQQFEGSMIDWFYGIHDGENSNLIQEFKENKRYIPKDMLVIANDPGNGWILLGIREKRRGKVYFWMPDFDEDQDWDAECITFAHVADSFNKFIANIRIV